MAIPPTRKDVEALFHEVQGQVVFLETHRERLADLRANAHPSLHEQIDATDAEVSERIEALESWIATDGMDMHLAARHYEGAGPPQEA
jgi:hypothetical protein